MQAEETVLDRIEIRKLKRFGHLIRCPKRDDQLKVTQGSQREEGKGDDLGEKNVETTTQSRPA
jgi:hypothetical protein